MKRLPHTFDCSSYYTLFSNGKQKQIFFILLPAKICIFFLCFLIFMLNTPLFYFIIKITENKEEFVCLV